MTRAICYAAKSTEDRHGSIPTQLEDGRRLAAIKGFEVVGEYQDEARSAYHANRGVGLANAMSHCERLAAEDGSCALLVQHSDRLARGDGRQARHLIEYVLWALKNDVELLSVQDPEILAGGDMQLLLGAIGGMRANQDSKRKADSVSDGLKRRAARGQSRGGPRPYGYRREYRDTDGGRHREGYYAVDPVEAAVIRRIYQDFVAGSSTRAIAAALTQERVQAIKGTSWPQASVRRILSRELYKGIVTDAEGTEYPGEHEAIIEPELWEQVAVLRGSHARRSGGRHAAGHHLLTKGILRCGKCGQAMIPRAAEGRPETYLCNGRVQWGPEYCDQSSVPREAIDGALLKELGKRYIDLEETQRRIQERHDANLAIAAQATAEADSEVTRAEARLRRVQRGYQDGFLDAEDYADQRTQLIGERDAATSAALRAAEHSAEVAANGVEADAESELLSRLAVLRAGVADGIERAADLNALRTVVQQLFDHIRYFDATHPLLTVDYVRQSGQPLPEGAYLVPMLQADTIVGYVDGDESRPILRKVAVPLESNVDAGEKPSQAG